MDQEQKIKDLEVELAQERAKVDELSLANSKLGYTVRLMSEFHLSLKDKMLIGEAMDNAETSNEVQGIYDYYFKGMHNKALKEDQDEFQWSADFKENLRVYYAVSLGYDPISKIAEDVEVVADYFTFENKVRNTPNGQERNALVDALLKKRPSAEESMNSIIDTINQFTITKEDKEEYED